MILSSNLFAVENLQRGLQNDTGNTTNFPAGDLE